MVRAQAEASRSAMLTPCGLPFHMQPVVPTGMGEAELPSTWAISSTVNSLHGSAALTIRGSVATSPNATSTPHRCADTFTLNLLACGILAKQKETHGWADGSVHCLSLRL